MSSENNTSANILTIQELITSGAIIGHKDGNYGSYYPKINEFGVEGVPFLTAKSINNGQIDFEGSPRLCFEKAKQLKFGFVQPNDVLLSHNATIGRVAIVPKICEECLIGTSLTYFRLNSQKLLPLYFAAYLSSHAFQAQLESVMGLSTRNQVPITAQRKLKIAVPDLRTQSAVAFVLGSINDRITLLRETNTTLEAIALALFKSWFVDFDPVRAKAEGRQPEGMDAATAALFPDGFEESELGEVPRGWRVGCLSDIAVQKKGSVNPLSTPNDWFEHYSLPAFDAAQAPVLEKGEAIKSNKTPLPAEAVLLSKLNPHIPRVWLPGNYGVNAVCSTEFLAYSPVVGSSKELIYCLFCSPVFQQQLCQLVTGTSNSHQRVKPDQILEAKIVLADKKILRVFSNIVKSIFESVYANRQQAQTLTQLRDTLLPRLISGQLRLPEAEQLMEETA